MDARSLLVACGECMNCRLHRRAERTGQAAMEGLYTQEKHGPGHVWMATLTVRDEDLDWHEPTPHNLSEWLPRLKPREGSKASGFTGIKRARYQMDRMESLYGMTDSEIRDYRNGRYQRVPTLNRRKIELYFMRLRKRGFKFRRFLAGEYGSERDRPHWHVLFFELTRREFEEALRMWPHGFTDPCPDTYKGQVALDKQEWQNLRPGAAAKYAAKYLTKGEEKQRTAATFARQHEYVDSRSYPALGFAWALEHIVPRLQIEFRAARRRYGEDLIAGYHTFSKSRYSKVDGWWYPFTRDFSHKLIAQLEWPEALVEDVKDFSVTVQHEVAAEIAAGGEIARKHEEQLREVVRVSKVREEKYARQQAEREKQWAKSESEAA